MRLPGLEGGVVRVTVIDVDVGVGEEAQVPAAPLLKEMRLSDAVVEKPVPVMTSDAALCARLAVFGTTVGGLRTVATCTAEPLDKPKDITTAVSEDPVCSWTWDDLVDERRGENSFHLFFSPPLRLFAPLLSDISFFSGFLCYNNGSRSRNGLKLVS